MEPSSNETGGMQLPPPINEQAPPAGLPPETDRLNVERQGVATSQERAAAPVVAGLPPAQAFSLPVPPQMPAPAAQTGVTDTTQASSLPLADDGDLIEKEWVDKAKQIVERTREDPYKQSEELTEVKADYMKQRYNKAIKLNK